MQKEEVVTSYELFSRNMHKRSGRDQATSQSDQSFGTESNWIFSVHKKEALMFVPQCWVCVSIRTGDALRFIRGDTKNRELLKNPTKIEEIQKKKKYCQKLNRYNLPFKRQ